MRVRALRARGDLESARAAAAAHRGRMREMEDMDRAMATTAMVQGALALQAGDSTEARDELRRAVREDPDHLASHALLAPLTLALGNRLEARASFGRLRQETGGRPPGPIFLETGKDLRRRGLPEVAISQFDLAVDRMPGNEEAVYWAAVTRLENGDAEGARAAAAPLERPPASRPGAVPPGGGP
jgi:Tfp pilus assembly protein PilF